MADHAFIAGTILCFAIHEGLAARCYSRRTANKTRFANFAASWLGTQRGWTPDVSARMWTARNGVIHAFGRDGNVTLLERNEKPSLKNFSIDRKSDHLYLRPEVYLGQLIEVFKEMRDRGELSDVGQFRGRRPGKD